MFKLEKQKDGTFNLIVSTSKKEQIVSNLSLKDLVELNQIIDEQIIKPNIYGN